MYLFPLILIYTWRRRWHRCRSTSAWVGGSRSPGPPAPSGSCCAPPTGLKTAYGYLTTTTAGATTTTTTPLPPSYFSWKTKKSKPKDDSGGPDHAISDFPWRKEIAIGVEIMNLESIILYLGSSPFNLGSRILILEYSPRQARIQDPHFRIKDSQSKSWIKTAARMLPFTLLLLSPIPLKTLWPTEFLLRPSFLLLPLDGSTNPGNGLVATEPISEILWGRLREGGG